ncbi:hypothetical protein MB02_06210 [Croceicoccus estronivorus]|uniref:MFS transporter n=1 Tax=Croceicoccus estronivorus TaxID=1172626 RepID=UPI0008332309|nr:MFS transporter [Croceicoccus estronivorus]OCC25024.1 hypothetical protein MB02_06210 [Croceicoccus estronivorus]
MSIVTGGQPAARRGLMLIRGFLSQNVAIGCSYGAFGVSLLALQERYSAGRGVISLGFSCVILGMGLLGPLIAASVNRFGLKWTMMTGAVLASCGYTVLALSSSTTAFLLAFAFLIGPGVALSGTLPVGLLVGGWYPEARGRAVGLATMPVLLSFMPMLGVLLIERLDLSGFYIILAALHFLMLPVLAGIHSAPPFPPAGQDGAKRGQAQSGKLLTSPVFWLMVLCGGVLNAVGITGVANMVALLIEQGRSPAEAGFLASLMGGSSVLGAFSVGWLCDRFGGGRALSFASAGFACGWLVLATMSGVFLMALSVFLIGVCGAGVFPAVNVLSTRIFGLERLAHVLGLFGLFTLPMTFILPPAAGLLHDITGSYRIMVGAIVLSCAIVAGCFFLLGRFERRAMQGAGD